jgi:hypothetical protein
MEVWAQKNRLGGLEVDNQLELRGCLNRKVGWPFTPKDAVNIGSGIPISLDHCRRKSDHRFWRIRGMRRSTANGIEPTAAQRPKREFPSTRGAVEPGALSCDQPNAPRYLGCTMSDEFRGLGARERAALEAALKRCRVLADQIDSILRKERREFIDKVSLAEFSVALERAADVSSAGKPKVG